MAAVVFFPAVDEPGTHMPVAVDAHRRVVQVAEHDPLGVVARERSVARVDGLAETDGDGARPRRDSAGRKQAALFGRGTCLAAPARACANARVRAGGEHRKDGNERPTMR